jgi:uncharacterized surface protein with fasciclin (FAS1) repeats
MGRRFRRAVVVLLATCVGACAFGTTVASAAEGVEEAKPVVLPPSRRSGSAWDVLREDEQHQRFAQLAAHAGLVEVLDGEHALTVLAPTDAAISEAELARLLLPENRAELRVQVAAHLSWKATPTAAVKSLVMRRSLPGETLWFELPDESAEPALLVNRVPLLEVDEIVVNGVVHRIGTLLPIEKPTGPVVLLRHAEGCDIEDSGHGGVARGSNWRQHRHGKRGDDEDRRRPKPAEKDPEAGDEPPAGGAGNAAFAGPAPDPSAGGDGGSTKTRPTPATPNRPPSGGFPGSVPGGCGCGSD